MYRFLSDTHLAGQSCSSKQDCPTDACCVHDQDNPHRATCQPMVGPSSVCYFRQADVTSWDQPEDVVKAFDQCPCEFGLYCFPVNGTDPVYGQIGVCVSRMA
ncbi:hypothetical protein RRG08_051691 [Elysia crispata]|uniref:Uncharacterized protein n=1 Tax=Elysia crispata TaxID=231223 RepID=A0AAE1AFB9_9GAST|nr:hypothetical protein RRG08_051691 [Elysia crispata]